MLDKKMAVIDWSKSAHEIDCLIRGLNPWPIALTSLAGERLKVFAAEKAAGNGEPGTVLEANPKKGLTVACGEGALKLTEIQPVSYTHLDVYKRQAEPSQQSCVRSTTAIWTAR